MSTFEFGELIAADGSDDIIRVLVITEGEATLPIELEFVRELAQLRAVMGEDEFEYFWAWVKESGKRETFMGSVEA